MVPSLLERTLPSLLPAPRGVEVFEADPTFPSVVWEISGLGLHSGAVAVPLAESLESADLAETSDDELVDALKGARRLADWVAARQVEAVGELYRRRLGAAQARLDAAEAEGVSYGVAAASRRLDMAERAVIDEVALELGTSRYSAQRLVSTAVQLSSDLSATLDALSDGEIDFRRAEVIAAGLCELSPTPTPTPTPTSAPEGAASGVESGAESGAESGEARLARIEAEVLAVAPELTIPGLRERITRILLREDGADRAEAAKAAASKRSVSWSVLPDEMIELRAYMTAEQGVRARTALEATEAQARTPGDERTVEQRRLDTCVDLLTGATESQRPGTQILVTIPMEALTDLTAEAAATAVPEIAPAPQALPAGFLEGYGPITGELARAIAMSVLETGTWRCAVTDTRHGTLLGLGVSTFTPTYTPSSKLGRHVRVRDRFCRFPGCRRQARSCDIDHRTPHAVGGDTCECNTQCLCAHHHRLKHETGFQVRTSEDPDHPPGTLVWTTPTGRRHLDRPERLRDPGPPPF